jgi:hypothetical protein
VQGDLWDSSQSMLGYYSSTTVILNALANCDAEALLPMTSIYLDDILCFGVRRCVGELMALAEFNQNNAFRQFDRVDWVSEFRPYKESLWLRRVFDLYCFGHLKKANVRGRSAGLTLRENEQSRIT